VLAAAQKYFKCIGSRRCGIHATDYRGIHLRAGGEV
jgi:hypothetical protein